MMYKTHVAFAIFLCLILSKFFNFDVMATTLISVFSTSIPDIDHTNSKISRTKLFRPISFLVSLISRHRGIFHGILMMAVLSLIVFRFFPKFLLGFCIGYGAHLFADLLTVQGIMIFWPSKYLIKGFIKTGGVLEYFFLLFCVAGSLFIVLL